MSKRRMEDRKVKAVEHKRRSVGGQMIASLLGAVDPQEASYETQDPQQAEGLIAALKDGGYKFGSRDDIARAKVVLPHLPPKTKPREPRRDAALSTSTEVHSVYSTALERQIELLRWLDTEGRGVFDAAVNPAIAGFADPAQCIRDCRESLDHGETFYFATHLLPAIETAAETMPDWTFADHMLNQKGFFWFGRALRLPQWDGETAPLAAVSWNHQVLNGVPARNFFFWVAVRNEYVPVCVYTWAAGELRTDVLSTRAQRFFPAGEDDNLEALRIDTEARDDMKLRLLAASVAFIDQRIFQSVKRSPSRSTRRRLPRHNDSLIHVIELRRRRQAPDHPADGVPRDWSCQWIVRGHWRQQWYPKLGRHQPKWITPYIKGPEDKPLRQPRATVFAVVR